MSTSCTAEDSKICKLCNKNPTIYCCPRCNVLYCSLECYKSELHAQCSESFYRDCFVEEMSSLGGDHADPSSKKSMMQILSQMHKATEEKEEDEDMLERGASEVDSDDDESLPDLADRLKDVDLNDCDSVWERLTEDERKEFEALLRDEDVTKIIPVWQPWWLRRKKKVLCEMIEPSETKAETDDYKHDCPAILNIATKFSDISKTPPADCVKYNLINVLGCYAYMARFFNGDHNNMEKEATSFLYSLSRNMKNNANFDDVESAVKSIVQESQNYPTFAADKDIEWQIMEDIKCMIIGPEDSNRLYYLLCALSDVHQLLSQYRKESNREESSRSNKSQFTDRFKDDTEFVPMPKMSVKPLVKKIEYYIMFVKEYGIQMTNEIERLRC